ncbi:MAG TPA: ATP synthase F0 subunit B [Flavobacteriales bacterium]|jgi:F-type H+-transporting ATPase subunit b|nr:F0F1 ATP synthase subunit B [Salibacteraceae bacterium]HAS36728.1 ATP synthase F0 subunit B [Flavobacteriales bacterium]
MGLVTPGFGLIFWTTLSFLIVLFLLRKMAWGPILKSLKEREDSIEGALQSAEKAKEEMEKLQSSNEALLREARDERDLLLKEARATKDAIVGEAKLKAKEEADRIISEARTAIENEKMAAITELKAEVANISLDIAEKLLRKELSGDAGQQELVDNMLSKVKLN